MTLVGFLYPNRPFLIQGQGERPFLKGKGKVWLEGRD